jgi:nitric oxide reductase NorQ protein
MTVAAGFVLQDPSSPMSKVYAAFAYAASDGTFEFITTSGSEGEWVSSRMRRQTYKTSLTRAEAVQLLSKTFADKGRRGYSRTLAGPVAFTSASTTPVDALVKAIRAEHPVMNPTTAAVKAAFDAAANAASPQAAAAPSGLRVHSSTENRLRLSSAEAAGITLPNGKIMYSREVAGHSDVAMLRHLRDQAAKGGPTLYVRLYGPPGGGKSTVPVGAFGSSLVRMNGHGDLTVAHFVGQYEPQPNGGFVWKDGPLTTAMKDGLPFHLDEASRIPSETMAILLSVADSRGELNLDDLPGSEPVRAAPGFYMVISYNETGQGVRPLDNAVKRRSPIAIEVSADFTAAEAAGVDPKAIKVARIMQTVSGEDVANGGLGYWVPQIADLLVFQQALDAGLGIEVAVATLLSACTDPDSVEVLTEKVTEVFGEAPRELALGGRVMGARR